MKDIYPIQGWGNKYGITKDGKIWHFRLGRYMSVQVNNCGYQIVGLAHMGKRACKLVHRLMAKTFLPNPDNKITVNHKNGIKDDNRLENLEWMTKSENSKHAYANGHASNDHLKEHCSRLGKARRKLTRQQVMKIRRDYWKPGMTQAILADKYNIARSSISSIINGKSYMY